MNRRDAAPSGVGSPTVIHIRFGPACSDQLDDGYDLITRRRVPELAPLVAQDALVVEGHVPIGFERVVAAQRDRLSPGHLVVAVSPCPATSRFWEQTAWTPVAGIVPEVRRTVEGCTRREPLLLLRAVLGDPPVADTARAVGSHDGVRISH